MKYQFIQQYWRQQYAARLCYAQQMSRCGHYTRLFSASSSRTNTGLPDHTKLIHAHQQHCCGSGKTWASIKQQDGVCERRRAVHQMNIKGRRRMPNALSVEAGMVQHSSISSCAHHHTLKLMRYAWVLNNCCIQYFILRRINEAIIT